MSIAHKPWVVLLAAALLLGGASLAFAQGGYFGPRPDAQSAPGSAPATQQPRAPHAAAPGMTGGASPFAPAPQATSPGPRGDSPPQDGFFGPRQEAVGPAIHIPYRVRLLLTRVAEYQRQINAALTGQVRRLHTAQFWAAAGTLFLLSFLYGVFHAVGPGHGKVITTAYLATRNARFRHALVMCAANAFAQSLTAIVLVGAFAMVVDFGSEWILGKSVWLEQISYGLIALVGCVMLFNAITGREHHHGGKAQADHAHGHDGAEGGHDHSHAAHAHAGAPSLRELTSTAVAVGIRPCSGAILVLLFTLANHAFWIGVIATLLIGAGVALTLSVMGIVTVGARVAVTAFVSEDSRLARVGARAMHLTAGGLLVLLGLLLLWASTISGSLGG